MTTTSTGNISGKVTVSGGSTLNLLAPLNLADPQGLDVSDSGSVVNMNGFPIVASKIFLGYYNTDPVTLNRGGAGGTLTVSDLYIGNAAYDVPATDKVQDLYLSNGTSTLDSNLATLTLASGSIGTTTVSGSITNSVFVSTGSTLNLGTDLNLSTELDVSGAGSVLNLNGHAISAVDILLGWDGDQPVTLNRGGAGGTLNAQGLFVGNCSFDLPATDTVGGFAQ